MCSAPEYPEIVFVPVYAATLPVPARLTKHRSRHCPDCQSAAATETPLFSMYPKVDPATCDSASHHGIEHRLELESNYLDAPFP